MSTNLTELLLLVIEASVKAGIATLDYYGKELEIEYKNDSSPLTKADIASNQIINDYLSKTTIPILSEENTEIEYQERKGWKSLWIVDPLDGTKEFVKNRKEYTVNIALIIDGMPVLGVIYAPVLDTIFYGIDGVGAFKSEKVKDLSDSPKLIVDNAVEIPIITESDDLVIVASQSHRNKETDEVIKHIENQHSNSVRIKSYGSSLKLCMIADGNAHIYPRLAPTMEWDIAAGHAIIKAAGYKVLTYPELEQIKYNKENLLNPWFVAFRSMYETYLT